MLSPVEILSSLKLYYSALVIPIFHLTIQDAKDPLCVIKFNANKTYIQSTLYGSQSKQRLFPSQ